MFQNFTCNCFHSLLSWRGVMEMSMAPSDGRLKYLDAHEMVLLCRYISSINTDHQCKVHNTIPPSNALGLANHYLFPRVPAISSLSAHPTSVWIILYWKENSWNNASSHNAKSSSINSTIPLVFYTSAPLAVGHTLTNRTPLHPSEWHTSNWELRKKTPTGWKPTVQTCSSEVRVLVRTEERS